MKMPLPTVIIDNRCRIISFNERVSQLFRTRLSGKNLSFMQLIDYTYHQRVQEGINQCIQNQQQQVVLVQIYQDDENELEQNGQSSNSNNGQQQIHESPTKLQQKSSQDSDKKQDREEKEKDTFLDTQLKFNLQSMDFQPKSFLIHCVENLCVQNLNQFSEKSEIELVFEASFPEQVSGDLNCFNQEMQTRNLGTMNSPNNQNHYSKNSIKKQQQDSFMRQQISSEAYKWKLREKEIQIQRPWVQQKNEEKDKIKTSSNSLAYSPNFNENTPEINSKKQFKLKSVNQNQEHAKLVKPVNPILNQYDQKNRGEFLKNQSQNDQNIIQFQLQNQNQGQNNQNLIRQEEIQDNKIEELDVEESIDVINTKTLIKTQNNFFSDDYQDQCEQYDEDDEEEDFKSSIIQNGVQNQYKIKNSSESFIDDDDEYISEEEKILIQQKIKQRLPQIQKYYEKIFENVLEEGQLKKIIGEDQLQHTTIEKNQDQAEQNIFNQQNLNKISKKKKFSTNTHVDSNTPQTQNKKSGLIDVKEAQFELMKQLQSSSKSKQRSLINYKLSETLENFTRKSNMHIIDSDIQNLKTINSKQSEEQQNYFSSDESSFYKDKILIQKQNKAQKQLENSEENQTEDKNYNQFENNLEENKNIHSSQHVLPKNKDTIEYLLPCSNQEINQKINQNDKQIQQQNQNQENNILKQINIFQNENKDQNLSYQAQEIKLQQQQQQQQQQQKQQQKQQQLQSKDVELKLINNLQSNSDFPQKNSELRNGKKRNSKLFLQKLREQDIVCNSDSNDSSKKAIKKGIVQESFGVMSSCTDNEDSVQQNGQSQKSILSKLENKIQNLKCNKNIEERQETSESEEIKSCELIKSNISLKNRKYNNQRDNKQIKSQKVIQDQIYPKDILPDTRVKSSTVNSNEEKPPTPNNNTTNQSCRSPYPYLIKSPLVLKKAFVNPKQKEYVIKIEGKEKNKILHFEWVYGTQRNIDFVTVDLQGVKVYKLEEDKMSLKSQKHYQLNLYYCWYEPINESLACASNNENGRIYTFFFNEKRQGFKYRGPDFRLDNVENMVIIDNPEFELPKKGLLSKASTLFNKEKINFQAEEELRNTDLITTLKKRNPQFQLSVPSDGLISISVVDNLLMLHSHNEYMSMIYDIKRYNPIVPLGAPQPLQQNEELINQQQKTFVQKNLLDDTEEEVTVLQDKDIKDFSKHSLSQMQKLPVNYIAHIQVFKNALL
ncbi:hypothetical protein PPERSA_07388 [Pseudocohnilembus persalinus]|uniref:Uncharacterized protein n=1 Tax=Pseudocohnilembus persalinus TaxID=266149 RepID=A0A0V0QA86_PSEPJ|nr:hypothetical protein PPERSA_07388 [Pseudocohnilembus persalinus]|eukprot:KRW99145.1 hypothetical protein PPERSA_07388 [Pseudocohnilembus persalinus]